MNIDPSNYSQTSLYVGDLLNDVTESQLYEIFKAIGPVTSIRVCRDAVTRRSLGYAYVNFHNAPDAERALELLNFTAIKGKPCRIMWCYRDPALRKSGVGNVFIKNLDKSLDQKDLTDIFSKCGNILSCKIAYDENGNSKGYGFVHYETQEAAELAISRIDGMDINGKVVYVGRFIPKRERIAAGADANASQKFTNVYVKELDKKVSSDQLKEVFGKFGTVTSAVVMEDRSSQSSKGFGFVNFEKHEAAKRAVDEMNGQPLEGKPIYVGRAQKKAEREAELKSKFEQLKMERIAKEAGVNLYIKNLDDTFNDAKLKEIFEPYGTISSAKVMRDEKTKASKGFGFVCFTTPEEATKAVTEMNGRMVGAKPLYVALAQRKEVRRAQLESYHRAQHQLARAGGFPGGSLYPPMGAPVFYPPQSNMPQRPGYPPVGAYPQQMVPRARWTPTPANQQIRSNYQQMPNYVVPVAQRQKTPKGRGQIPGQAGVVPGQPNQQRAGNGPAGAGAQGPNADPNAARGFKFTNNARNQVPTGGAAPSSSAAASQDGLQPSLTQTDLDALDMTADDKKNLIGENLFPLISAVQPNHAGKITGMFIETFQINELMDLLKNPQNLQNQINEAMTAINNPGEQGEQS